VWIKVATIKPRIMEQMTVKEVREGLLENKTVIVPVGCLEQHGYHLPLNTDIVIPYEVAKATSERTGCFVAAPVTYSFSGGTLPGTTDVTPQVYSLVLQDICQSLCKQGFINIVVLLGHGGTENRKATYDAIDMFLRRSSYGEEVAVAVLRSSDIFPSGVAEVKKGDFHAGFVETSLMLYLRPELVRSQIAMDEPKLAQLMRTDQDAYQVKKKVVDEDYIIPRITQNPAIKVGVMGYPEKATAEIGKKFFEERVTNCSAIINKLSADNK
jgi:creatinine amidohydrolase